MIKIDEINRHELDEMARKGYYEDDQDTKPQEEGSIWHAIKHLVGLLLLWGFIIFVTLISG